MLSAYLRYGGHKPLTKYVLLFIHKAEPYILFCDFIVGKQIASLGRKSACHHGALVHVNLIAPQHQSQYTTDVPAQMVHLAYSKNNLGSMKGACHMIYYIMWLTN